MKGLEQFFDHSRGLIHGPKTLPELINQLETRINGVAEKLDIEKLGINTSSCV